MHVAHEKENFKVLKKQNFRLWLFAEFAFFACIKLVQKILFHFFIEESTFKYFEFSYFRVISHA